MAQSKNLLKQSKNTSSMSTQLIIYSLSFKTSACLTFALLYVYD